MKIRLFFLYIFLGFAIQLFAQPTPPSSLTLTPYPMNIDISWTPSTDASVTGYKVYKKESGNYFLLGQTSKDEPYFVHWVGDTNITVEYSVTSFTASTESGKSSSFSATTKSATDSELLDMVQKTSFRYFWDYAHKKSGLARERLGSGNTVTIGGSGMGIMTIPIAIERGWITREQGAAFTLKMVNFLKNSATRFHGIWSHWLNGETGTTIPFSTYDDGGDMVESAFMLQGMLAVRQYFDGTSTNEILIRQVIGQLWEAAEFDWYLQTSNSNYLYWHWSPKNAWKMNMPIKGWNEGMICYLLGIASPTHAIPAGTYSKGWAASGYLNGKFFYQKKLYLGSDYGGPLFFTHYSFLGFDPRGKKDGIVNSGFGNEPVTYFDNHRNTALIHYNYSINNPKSFAGYSKDNWGLTASDDPFGYTAHQPMSNDNGTISPTAALSSFPYTPVESMLALKYFYFQQGEKLWGVYGFKDAFNLKENWYADSYLAIDQGPIIVMIENYRTHLLWNLFMRNTEIQDMMPKIGMTDLSTDVQENESPNNPETFRILSAYPNPFNPSTLVRFYLPKADQVSIDIFDIQGRLIHSDSVSYSERGSYSFEWNVSNRSDLSSGLYFIKLQNRSQVITAKVTLLK